MQNITLSADPLVIERARQKAKASRTTLNQASRDWIASYAAPAFDEAAYQQLLRRVSYARAGRRFTRDEMNER
jgi:hypothetical protein